MKLKICLTLLLCNIFWVAFAQNDKENSLDVDVQLRPRAELRAGAYRPLAESEDPAFLIQNRTRINMNYKFKDRLALKLSLQNINIWGQAAQVQLSDPTGGMQIYEAYADLNLNKGFSTKIGRQALVLDDDRFFGSLDWHSAGRAHDALNFGYNKEKFEAQLYGAYNQNYKVAPYNNNIGNPSNSFYNSANAQPYKHLEMLYTKIVLDEKSSYLSFFINNVGYQNAVWNTTATEATNTDVYNLVSFAGNYFGKYEKWKPTLTAAYQTGKNASGRKTDAFLLSANIGYQLSKATNVFVATDYLSGNANNSAATTTNKAFDPSFATNHKFYGFMDYYYVGNSHSNVGLMDNYAGFNTKFKTGTLGTTLHVFSAANDIVDASNKDMSKYLGTEIDVFFSKKVLPMVTLMGGYSMYLNTSSLNRVKNVTNANDSQHWVWFMVNINPSILKLKF